MESFMLDICQILLILIEIWKVQKENQLYSICLGTCRYFLFKYLTNNPENAEIHDILTHIKINLKHLWL